MTHIHKYQHTEIICTYLQCNSEVSSVYNYILSQSEERLTDAFSFFPSGWKWVCVTFLFLVHALAGCTEGIFLCSGILACQTPDGG